MKAKCSVKASINQVLGRSLNITTKKSFTSKFDTQSTICYQPWNRRKYFNVIFCFTHINVSLHDENEIDHGRNELEYDENELEYDENEMKAL